MHAPRMDSRQTAAASDAEGGVRSRWRMDPRSGAAAVAHTDRRGSLVAADTDLQEEVRVHHAAEANGIDRGHSIRRAEGNGAGSRHDEGCSREAAHGGRSSRRAADRSHHGAGSASGRGSHRYKPGEPRLVPAQGQRRSMREPMARLILPYIVHAMNTRAFELLVIKLLNGGAEVVAGSVLDEAGIPHQQGILDATEGRELTHDHHAHG